MDNLLNKDRPTLQTLIGSALGIARENRGKVDNIDLHEIEEYLRKLYCKLDTPWEQFPPNEVLDKAFNEINDRVIKNM